MKSEQISNMLEGYVPGASLGYCIGLWEQHPFDFRLSKKRSTKLGDYRFVPASQAHQISVNHNLNQHEFLITYIHEVAHLFVIKKHGRRVAPHGHEWKLAFKELMHPVLIPSVFPVDILPILTRHMRNPKAASTSDFALVKALRGVSANKNSFSLDDVKDGQTFVFRQKPFRKINTRRTRVLCENLSNNKKYLIPKAAEVVVTNLVPFYDP